MSVGNLEEIIDDNHAIVSTSVGSEHYVSILSFVDKDQLEPGCSVLLNHKVHAVVGVLGKFHFTLEYRIKGENSSGDDTDPMVTVMKLEKAPQETYADIGGLDTQIQEIKESVELPLTHPEYYEEMGIFLCFVYCVLMLKLWFTGIKPPKGVILYGPPGTGKTLLAKAVANQTSATFLRVVGSELIQKYLGDGPKLVRELFRVAEEHAPSIVFIDEIDAVSPSFFMLRMVKMVVFRLVQNVMTQILVVRGKSKEQCWNSSISLMVLTPVVMLRYLVIHINFIFY